MGDFDPRTILLVDDEAIIAMAEKLQLEKEGYRVIISASGEGAIGLVREKKTPIDLILMDIDLGQGIDGTVAAEEILKESTLPVLFLSSHKEREIVERTERITSYGYVVKNSGITVLNASIKMAFRLFEANAQLRMKEMRLRESESWLNSIIDQSPYPMWISDETGSLIRINDACLALLGISLENVLGKYNICEDSIVVEQGHLPLVRSVFEEGKVAKFEIVYDSSRLKGLSLNGFVNLILNVTVFPIRNEKGEVTNAVIQHIDVTERRMKERALIESEKRFRLAMDASMDGLWEWSLETDEAYYNPAYCRMLGYDPGEFPMTVESWRSMVHPEDRDPALALIAECVDNRRQGFEAEYRMRAKDGSWKRVFSRGLTTERGDGGRALRMTGTHVDRTLR